MNPNFWQRKLGRLRAIEPDDCFHEKLGFQRDGRLRRMIFTDGQFHDEILLGLTDTEFLATGGDPGET